MRGLWEDYQVYSFNNKSIFKGKRKLPRPCARCGLDHWKAGCTSKQAAQAQALAPRPSNMTEQMSTLHVPQSTVVCRGIILPTHRVDCLTPALGSTAPLTSRPTCPPLETLTAHKPQYFSFYTREWRHQSSLLVMSATFAISAQPGITLTPRLTSSRWHQYRTTQRWIMTQFAQHWS